MEDYAHILDYFPQGHPESKKFRREPIALAVGESEFKLFELIPKPDAIISIGDRVYIGKDLDKRDKIAHVKRRIGYEELSNAAQSELPFALLEIVKLNEERFIKFFNEAHPITTRFHLLELLPGLGKKTMLAVLDERKKAPFKSFEDLNKRVASLHQSEKIIARRIERELANPNEKYMIFVQRKKSKGKD